ncbi:flagellar biosynthesis repressor FlbT [Azospirillum lipoferum]|uniref:Flagellum biosynthesis repressor protein flbT-like n=1 Tax=Azospirillum lipoferum (strain 4B) TaxID=862719 RepID=G7ZAK5_AZOL4|nr:flagellar biosynthesis repressor FlbT [Azospirillum lipoferum]CBS88822.1 putative Flagellum biosynthesis repressor protein flbT-like [Azospirillum lipoferum 4B]
MPLKFVLRPNEKVIINGAVIGAGDRPGSFFLYNTANFLRGREVLKEEQIDCIEKKLYFVIQLVYIFPEDATLNLQRFASILDETRQARPDASKVLDEIERLVEARNYYRALKLCRKMFRSADGGAGNGGTGDAEAGDDDDAPADDRMP